MLAVPATDVQSGGPLHHYRIGRTEVTNAEYARFLNDALAHPDDERGRFLVHDGGRAWVRLSGDGTPVFDGGAGAAIVLDGGRYRVVAGHEEFPVSGVSWYGAAKYCNWLTVVQGMPLSGRAYLEGATAADWRPAAGNAGLVAGYVGFRLPMDDGSPGVSRYNEWYKAASRKGTDGNGRAIFGAVYGFGRDVLGGADANYVGSGDPYDDGSAPVAYFDGVNRLADGQTATRDTANGYGLYDLTGNVAEWVHDLTSPGPAAMSATRGGHYLSTVGDVQLRTDRRVARPAAAVLAYVGFRACQSLTPVPLSVTQDDGEVRAEGPVGGDYNRESFTLRLRNGGAYTADDVDIAVTYPPGVGAWLEFDGVPPSQVQPGAEALLRFRFSDGVAQVGVSPAPPGDFVLVPRRDVEEGGPAYDFWMSRTEVRNDQLVTFLNDARTHPDDARGAYMSFDRTTGSVYVNDEEPGVERDGPPPGPALLLYDATVGAVRLTESGYVVDGALGAHPATGVTWYGAVKYANWLTVFAGLPDGLRAYGESTNDKPSGWRPVTIPAGDWSRRDLLPAERSALIGRTLGYRLPMDGGAAGADPFGEWFKAASFAGVDETGEPRFDSVYGFGRDLLEGVDANFLDSGDPNDEGTTPVGFFNGVNLLADGVTVTRASDNGYRLDDLCGNLTEWTQDFGSFNDASTRGLRGGSWDTDPSADALKTTGREAVAAGTAPADVGLRLVRGTGHVAAVTITDRISGTTTRTGIILDLFEPLVVSPRVGVHAEGRYGDDFSAAAQRYVVSNESVTEMGWRVTQEGGERAWLTVEGPNPGRTEGRVPGGADVAIDVSINTQASLLPPGVHDVVLSFTDTTTGVRADREVTLSIEQPIAVDAPPEPVIEGILGGPFDDPASLRYMLRSLVDFPLDYGVSVQGGVAWLDVTPVAPARGLTGPLPAGGAVAFDVAVNEQAEALDCGSYDADLHFAFMDRANEDLTSGVDQTLTLIVRDIISITQEADPEDAPLWRVGPELDPLPQQVYRLENHDAQREVRLDVAIVEPAVEWVDVDDPMPIVPPLATVPLRVAINESVRLFVPGAYTATLRFENLLTGCTQDRTIVLTVGGVLGVVPGAGLDAWGRRGGQFTPPARAYVLTNVSESETLRWRAVPQPPTEWITINGAAEASGTLAPAERALVVVALDESADALPAGTYTATVEFLDEDAGESLTARAVSLTVVEPRITTLAESVVAAGEAQPGGPVHTIRMGTHEVTNAACAAFLNDALQHLSDDRGAYLLFDEQSGAVYLNTRYEGEIGTGSGTVLFDPAVGGRVAFDGTTYSIAQSYADHPVVGVSWYGALKFCNWLTLDQGIEPGQRCYAESAAPDVNGWHPVTIATADWAQRDLNDAERRLLVEGYRGFRLPMDEGYNNTDPATDTADGYNEWYKAAAWVPGRRTNARYGFGRDAITGADANYRDSGDPFDNGTTPVGYYDGSDHGGAFPTNREQNGFGAFDLSGNVYEWMQGRYNAHPQSIGFRAFRGGGWDRASADLEVRKRSYMPPELTSRQVGFRVVRTPPTGDGDTDGDGDVDLADLALLPPCLEGPDAAVVDWCARFDADGDGDVDAADFAGLQSVFVGQ
jgi:formylglycine-generating enzyme required for sulfatase activity